MIDWFYGLTAWINAGQPDFRITEQKEALGKRKLGGNPKVKTENTTIIGKSLKIKQKAENQTYQTSHF